MFGGVFCKPDCVLKLHCTFMLALGGYFQSKSKPDGLYKGKR